MTATRFDPRIMEAYEVAPPLLHFEFGDSGRVYRYVMVGSFAAGVLDADTRRTQGERDRKESHEIIRARLLLEER